MVKRVKIVRLGDIIVFLGLAASSLLLIWAGSNTPEAAPDVEITVGGEVVNFAPLGQDWLYEAIGPLGATVVECRGGYVWVRESCCRNKVCVKYGKIKTVGQTIVCLPNQVVIRIVGMGDVDAVAM